MIKRFAFVFRRSARGKRGCCMNMRDNVFLRDDVKMLKQSIRKTLHILSLMLRVLQPSLPHHLHGSKSRRQEQIQLIQNVSKIVIIWRVHVLVEASKFVGDFLLFPFIFSPSSFRYQSKKGVVCLGPRSFPTWHQCTKTLSVFGNFINGENTANFLPFSL